MYSCCVQEMSIEDIVDYLSTLKKDSYNENATRRNTSENHLQDILRLLNEASNMSYSLVEKQLLNHTMDLSSLIITNQNFARNVILCALYSIVFVVSGFGNSMVFRVAWLQKYRTRTTILIANLAVSDILTTLFNIPFNLYRMLKSDWHLGSVLCNVLPFVQALAVYASSFTMLGIALDRYRAVVYPFSLLLKSTPASLILTAIWTGAAIISIPHSMYNEIVEIYTYRIVRRCQMRYPYPQDEYRKWFTLFTFLTQYVIPLSVTAVSYSSVVRQIWCRQTLGAVTPNQLMYHTKTRKKTIKILVLVVIVFAICWLPLNLFNVITDFQPKQKSSTAYLICHFIAMCSVCCNPFIYCWLNEAFRTFASSYFVHFLQLLQVEWFHRMVCENLLPRLKISYRTSLPITSSKMNRINSLCRCLVPPWHYRSSNRRLVPRQWLTMMDMGHGTHTRGTNGKIINCVLDRLHSAVV